MLPAVEVQSLNHWTARQVPIYHLLLQNFYLSKGKEIIVERVKGSLTTTSDCVLLYFYFHSLYSCQYLCVFFTLLLFCIYIYIYVCIYTGEGNGTPLQHSCLENPMDGGAWWAAVHGVSRSRTQLSDFAFTFHFHALEKEMATHSSVLAWRIPGMGSLVGCHLWSHTELDTTDAT